MAVSPTLRGRRVGITPTADHATHEAPTASGAARVNLYDEVTARIIGELEAGRFPWV